MNYESDLFLKDEGDMMTVCFQTPKAIEAFKQQPIEVIENSYGDVTYKKIDLDLTAKNKRMMISFAVSHDLTLDHDLEL